MKNRWNDVLTNFHKKNNCPTNNQVTYPFINFKWIYWFFRINKLNISIFVTFLNILKNERNVTNFGYVFVSRFHTTDKFFNLHGCSPNFFQQRFKKPKKNWKNSYRFWKINKFISNEKPDRLPYYLLNHYFVY